MTSRKTFRKTHLKTSKKGSARDQRVSHIYIYINLLYTSCIYLLHIYLSLLDIYIPQVSGTPNWFSSLCDSLHLHLNSFHLRSSVLYPGLQGLFPNLDCEGGIPPCNWATPTQSALDSLTTPTIISDCCVREFPARLSRMWACPGKRNIEPVITYKKARSGPYCAVKKFSTAQAGTRGKKPDNGWVRWGRGYGRRATVVLEVASRIAVRERQAIFARMAISSSTRILGLPIQLSERLWEFRPFKFDGGSTETTLYFHQITSIQQASRTQKISQSIFLSISRKQRSSRMNSSLWELYLPKYVLGVLNTYWPRPLANLMASPVGDIRHVSLTWRFVRRAPSVWPSGKGLGLRCVGSHIQSYLPG